MVLTLEIFPAIFIEKGVKMTISPFMAAINQIVDEKNLSKEVVVETIEAAIAVAFRKDYGKQNQNFRVRINEDGGILSIHRLMEVVEEVEEEEYQISLEEAKKTKKNAKVGDILEFEEKIPEGYGRIAAQTAKQVIIQRLREAERDVMFKEYKDKEGTVLVCTVQRIEGKNVIVDLGRANGIMFPSEQVPGERYYVSQRLKVYLLRVEETSKGPQILVSRATPELVKYIFAVEVPEIEAGTVIIKAVAREAGSRTKVAVWSDQEGVDPVGSCVGQRGTRVQAIISELANEKIDIVLWDEKVEEFISNALSPAKVTKVKLNEADKQAYVYVPADQLSLAIGKQGQNVRLAARLCGWKIDIAEASAEVVEKTEQEEADKDAEGAAEESIEKPKKAKKKTKKAEDAEIVEQVEEEAAVVEEVAEKDADSTEPENQE